MWGGIITLEETTKRKELYFQSSFENSTNFSKERAYSSSISQGVYSLRHSFVTYPLESRIDLRYIQELLGYKSSKITEIYTHVSTEKFSVIKSPLGSSHTEGCIYEQCR